MILIPALPSNSECLSFNLVLLYKYLKYIKFLIKHHHSLSKVTNPVLQQQKRKHPFSLKAKRHFANKKGHLSLNTLVTKPVLPQWHQVIL